MQCKVKALAVDWRRNVAAGKGVCISNQILFGECRGVEGGGLVYVAHLHAYELLIYQSISTSKTKPPKYLGMLNGILNISALSHPPIPVWGLR
jgi:hypothetical protein